MHSFKEVLEGKHDDLSLVTDAGERAHEIDLERAKEAERSARECLAGERSKRR